MMKKSKQRTRACGRVIIASGLNVREHEIRTAQALAAHGMVVEFIPESFEERITSPDVLIDGVRWEIKSPTASNSKALERNLRRALRQSENVILDSRRMKLMADSTVRRELVKLSTSISKLRKLMLIK